MAGHLACIGVDTEDEFVRVVERAAAEGKRVHAEDGVEEIVWRDEAGASMALDLGPDRALVCARPSFDASSWLDVRLTGIAEDPECPFCTRVLVDVLDPEGELVYPVALELENIAEARSRRVEGAARVAVTAFAEQLESWPDETAYEAAQTLEPGFAAMSFIPAGLFVEPAPKRRLRRAPPEPPPTAHGLLTGVVRDSSVRTNSVTGRPFTWARVETYGGEYDLVASAEDAPKGFRRGGVVQAGCWLIGRLKRR